MAASLFRRRSSRLAVFALSLALVSALSCGREITGPMGGGVAGAVALRPTFSALRLPGQSAPVSVSGLVDFVRVRIVLLRANGDTAVNRVVEFPADSQSISLTIPVALSSGASADGETFNASLRFVNAAGDTVFKGGPIAVQARPLGAAPAEPPAIPITYTGPGSTAASLTLSADTVSGRRSETKTLNATVRDAQGTVLSNVPIAFSTLDTAMATVGLTSGTVAFQGIRGQTRIIAQTLTGQADTALVLVFPIPTAIAFLPEATGQQVRQREAFPKPAAVKVTAADGLPVAGTIVDFVVTRGKGSVSQAKDTTDNAGVASVVWTAGDSVGTGELLARLSGGTLTATMTGVQLNAGPTSLRFIAQPTNVVAQDTLSPVSVVVFDAIQDTVRAFTGPVRLALTGGRPGAILTGTTKVNAVRGVAQFTDLTVDRDGTNYSLIASLDSTLAVPAVTSTPFAVTPRPVGAVALLSGGGQQTTFGTAFATPIIFQVRGLKGEAIRDVIVNFAATGGGTLSQAQDTSDALGQVSVTWTAGSTAGDVTLTATVLGGSISGTAVNRQGSAAPTAVEFLTQPTAIAAGDTLPWIRVRVLNGLGVPITDYAGAATLGLNGGTAGAVLLNNGSGVSFNGGIAEFRGLSVDRAGSGYRLKTQVTGTSVVALSDSFAVTPAPATGIQIISGDFQSAVAGAALKDSLVFRVVNRFAQGVAGQTVTFTVPSGGGSVSPTSVVTDAMGRVAVKWTTGLTGDQKLNATAGSLPPAVATAYIPQTLTSISGGGQKVFHGETAISPIVFRVVQANGSALRGIPVTFSVGPTTGGTVTPVNAVSDDLGEVRTQWTAGTVSNGDVEIMASIPGMPSAFTTVVVKQGTRNVVALRHLTVPQNIVAGDTIPTLKVATLNGLGDTATTFTGAVRLALSGGPTDATLLGTTTVNAVAGFARFPGLTVDRAFTGYRLSATLPADATVPAQLSDAFTVTAAPATGIQIISGDFQSAVAGAALKDSLVFRVVNRFAQGVAGQTVTFTVPSGGGSVSPTSVVTDAMGRVAVKWTTGLTGDQKLNATAGSLPPAVATAYIPQTLTSISGGGQKVFHGETAISPIVFRVVQANGSALRGIPVTFSVGSTTGGTVTPVNAVSDDLGEVRTQWTAGTVSNGDVEIIASIPGMPSAFTTVVVKQGTRNPVALRYATAPSNIVAGDPLPPLKVVVLNGLGDTVKTFTSAVDLVIADGLDVALVGTTTVNAVAGVATFSGLTVERAFAGYRLSATLPADETVPAQLSDAFTVTAATPASVLLVSGDVQSAPPGTTLANPIVVRVVDRFGNWVQGATVSFTVLAGGGTVSPSSRSSDLNGLASTSWTLGSAGTQTISVTVTGSSVSPLTVTATLVLP